MHNESTLTCSRCKLIVTQTNYMSCSCVYEIFLYSSSEL